MAPTPGWYDDPRDAGRLRYWDGAAWTEHVTPRQPAVEAPPPGPQMPVFPGAAQAQQQSWQYGQPPQQQSSPPWQPYPAGQLPGQLPGQPASLPPNAVVTPDGVQITSWVKRFAARLLDSVFVFIGTLPLTGYFLYRAADQLANDMDKGSYNAFSPSSNVVGWESAAIAIVVVAELVYEAFCLRRWGATPGKRVLGISVRRWDRGGPLPWPTIARRVGFLYALAAISLVPVVGVLASVLGLVNYLFPLWDKRHQALHDKVAQTVVIEGARRENS